MQFGIGRVEGTGRMVVRFQAETFAEVLLLGRWEGHVEAAGHKVSATVIETTAVPGDQTPAAAVILILPIERTKNGDRG